MTVNILTFVCGIAVGLCAAFILVTLVNARRRRRHFGVPNVVNQETARRMAEQWRRDNPDIVKAWNDSKRNDEPTELDQ